MGVSQKQTGMSQKGVDRHVENGHVSTRSIFGTHPSTMTQELYFTTGVSQKQTGFLGHTCPPWLNRFISVIVDGRVLKMDRRVFKTDELTQSWWTVHFGDYHDSTVVFQLWWMGVSQKQTGVSQTWMGVSHLHLIGGSLEVLKSKASKMGDAW